MTPTATEEKVTGIDLESLKALLGEQKNEVQKAVSATLSDWNTKADEKFKTWYQVVGEKEKKEAAVETPAKAELGESMSGTFNKVAGFEILGIPIGAAAFGGFGAIFITEVVDGYFKNQSAMVRGGIKLGGAFVIAKFLPRYIGKDLCNAAALLIAFDGLKNDILPSVFAYATTWANKLTGTTTVAGLGHTGGMVIQQTQVRPSVMEF